MGAPRKRLVYFERFLHPVATEVLMSRPDIDVVRLSHGSTDAENWRQIERAHAFQVSATSELVRPWFGNAELLARCPDLLAVCSAGAGYDAIDIGACTASGVIACNQGGANSRAVAEHAVGFIIALGKKIGLSQRALLRGEAGDRMRFWGNDVQHKTVGLVGFGMIGMKTAELCRALGMTVVVHDPALGEDVIASRGFESVGFGQLLERSDFVSVHCPLVETTRRLFDRDAFARMKRSAYFINTARGQIHDEAALLDALQRGTIAGAGLDVFEVEPTPPTHPLLQLDNVIATPHIAGGTQEGIETLARRTAEQWIAILDGRYPPRLLNPEAWPRYCERYEGALGVRPSTAPETSNRP